MNPRRLERKTYVQKQILRTLLEMMKEQELSSITISALTERAGVGRASFYRNYTVKEDVLRREAERLMRVWQRWYDLQPHDAPNSLLISLLNFYKRHADFYMTLYRVGMAEMICDKLLERSEITRKTPNVEAYAKSADAYRIYGWIIEWIKRGMQESGTELAEMIEQSLGAERKAETEIEPSDAQTA